MQSSEDVLFGWSHAMRGKSEKGVMIGISIK